MSESQSTKADLQFILPKEGSSAVSLPKKDPSLVTKIIDLQIEDFLEKLNDAYQRQDVWKNIITSPSFLIGDERVVVNIHFDEEDMVLVSVELSPEFDIPPNLQSLLFKGNCGNLSLEMRDEGPGVVADLELGSIAELKEAMTSSGNHQLNLQLTLTALEIEERADDQWIIPRYVFHKIDSFKKSFTSKLINNLRKS